MLLFVKHEVHRCYFLQFLIHFYSLVLLIGSFNFSSQYVLLAHTSCNTSNIMYYSIILYTNLCFKIFNRIAALLNQPSPSYKYYFHCSISNMCVCVCDLAADPLSLADICRQSIRRQLGKNRLRDVRKLPLPTSLQNYLLYQ